MLWYTRYTTFCDVWPIHDMFWCMTETWRVTYDRYMACCDVCPIHGIGYMADACHVVIWPIHDVLWCMADTRHALMYDRYMTCDIWLIHGMLWRMYDTWHGIHGRCMSRSDIPIRDMLWCMTDTWHVICDRCMARLSMHCLSAEKHHDQITASWPLLRTSPTHTLPSSPSHAWPARLFQSGCYSTRSMPFQIL